MATDQQFVDPLFGDNPPGTAVAPSGAVVNDPLFGPGVQPARSPKLARDLPEVIDAPRVDVVRAAIQGNRPEEGFNILGSFLTSAGFLSASDQDERAQILLNQFPDAFQILAEKESGSQR